MFGRFSKYADDQKGAVAPLFAVGLIGLVSVGALAWDISRAFALRAELDSAVDAAALAGATQLDGKADARTRAIAAAQGAFVQNMQRLGDTAETNVVITNGDIGFLQDLATRAAATSDANANLIEINLTPRSLGVVMGAMVQATSFSARAHAVAGAESALCLAPPILVCNPDETSTNLDFDHSDYIGKVLQLTPAPNGGSNSWPAGNFGFIDVGNVTHLKEAMAGMNDNVQCYGETVTTQPGNVASADTYYNTRFDIYEKGAPSGKGNTDYQAAMNTMIGTKAASGSSCSPNIINPPNSCANSTAVDPYGFPIDCDQTGPVGSGVWNVAKYFNSNHPGVSYASPVGGAPAQPLWPGSGWEAYGPAPAAGATSPTRYQVYNWELAMIRTHRGEGNGIAVAATAFGGAGHPRLSGSGAQDFAQPTCNTSSAQQTPDKRLISALIANCADDGVKGRSVVHPITEVSLFLVAPTPTSGAGKGNIFGEVVGSSSVYGEGEDRVGATRRYWVRLYE